MSEFWPEDLDLNDTQSPLEILESARDEWANESGGTLNLVLQKTTSTDDNTCIVVHALHPASNRTAALLSVFHRPGSPYPTTISLRKDELPKVLQSSYYEPSIVDMAGGLTGILAGKSGKVVQNQWVSNTPGEFREKLKRALRDGSIKSHILNLFAVPPEATSTEKGASDSEEDE